VYLIHIFTIYYIFLIKLSLFPTGICRVYWACLAVVRLFVKIAGCALIDVILNILKRENPMKKLFFAVISLMLTLVFTSLVTAPLAYAAADLETSVYLTSDIHSIKYQVSGNVSWCTRLGAFAGTGWDDGFVINTSDGKHFLQPGDTVDYIRGYSDDGCANPIQGLSVGTFTVPSGVSHCWMNLTNGNQTCS
jgi:hypothetical protein